jgi:hypothetical protein
MLHGCTQLGAALLIKWPIRTPCCGAAKPQAVRQQAETHWDFRKAAAGGRRSGVEERN